MGISLTGLTPATTYDALIKVGDNGPITASLKVLSDGLGTNLPIEASTTAINFTGALQQSGVAVPTAGQVAAKQDTLVSGTNIKTINGASVLGAGNIVTPSTPPSGVVGAIQFSTGSAFNSDAANFFWDNTNKRLGIGTNAPNNTTEIQIPSAYGAIGSNANLYLTSALTSAGIKIGVNGSGAGCTIQATQSGGGTAFNLGLNPFGGSVNIGNSNLGASLGIKGSGSTSATTSLLVQNSAGAASLQVTDDGSVYNLGKGSISTNTVFGRAVFGANITGSENVAIGFDVLSANTSGSLNTAVGNSALKSNTNGIENVAVGVNALGNNIGGNQNVAVGRSALGANLTGSNNCAIGFDAQTGNFSSSVILGRSASATASNQFVVGSTAHNAGAVNSTTDVPATFLWTVRINGTNYKILMTT